MTFLRLIRLPNLLLIVLVQLLIRYCLVMPAFKAEYFITGEFPPYLHDVQFFILVLSTVLIAAGGYIVNDIFDTDIDAVNRPGRVIIGKRISEKSAWKAYRGLTVAGVAGGIYLAVVIRKPVMAFIHPFAAVSLFLYASQLKKRLVWGNLLVAFLSALVLLVAGLFEPEFYRNFTLLALYAGFAFLVSLQREIIKDMEDLEGDEQGQVKSLPVRFGIARTKGIVLLLIVVTGWLLGNVLYRFFFTNTVFNYWNMLVVCELPLAALLYLTAVAREKKDFHLASAAAKIVMLLGMLSLLPLYYYFIL
jgi:4-hydroxybenzoate polyprenyltransferase